MSPNELLNKRSFFDPLQRNVEVKNRAIQDRIKNAGQKELIRRNKKRNIHHEYKIGSYVYIKNLNSGKLGNFWLGPYKVLNLRSNGSLIEVELPNKKIWMNMKLIKPANLIGKQIIKRGRAGRMSYIKDVEYMIYLYNIIIR